jgi:predicted tellurium resistance membrane protein TerC
VLGTAGAVVLRIGLTFFAARLLDLSFLKLTGGLMIVWLAIKLFIEGGPEDSEAKEVKTVGKAVLTILIADLIMSTDNVLAVAGASKGIYSSSSLAWAPVFLSLSLRVISFLNLWIVIRSSSIWVRRF